MNINESDRNGDNRRISGLDLKRIREKCGYSAREFANLLQSTGARITTARSVYRLEERLIIPSRYVDALTKLVGAKNFDASLQAIIQEEEEAQRQREERRRKQDEEEQERKEKRHLKRVNEAIEIGGTS